jgi:hypothetical protein
MFLRVLKALQQIFAPEKGWGVFGTNNGIHVMPLFDRKPHTFTHDCHCEPEITTESENFIIAHKAFDFREVHEAISGNILFE